MLNTFPEATKMKEVIYYSHSKQDERRRWAAGGDQALDTVQWKSNRADKPLNWQFKSDLSCLPADFSATLQAHAWYSDHFNILEMLGSTSGLKRMVVFWDFCTTIIMVVVFSWHLEIYFTNVWGKKQKTKVHKHNVIIVTHRQQWV